MVWNKMFSQGNDNLWDAMDTMNIAIKKLDRFRVLLLPTAVEMLFKFVVFEKFCFSLGILPIYFLINAIFSKRRKNDQNYNECLMFLLKLQFYMLRIIV